MQSTLTENQLAKVLVCCDQDCIPTVGRLKDFLIRDAWIQLGNVSRFMSFETQPFDDVAIHTLIGNQIHADLFGTG